MIEGKYVNSTGTHVVATLEEQDLDRIKRHADAQGFEYEADDDDALTLRVSVVDGVVYRNPDASPSAKFGDTKEIRIQITEDGLTGYAPTIFSPVILTDDLDKVLSQLSLEPTDYATAYRLEFTEEAPAFDEIPDALRRLGITVEDAESGFVCRLDDYEFKLFDDGLAYPNHPTPEESQDIERLVNVLNEAIRR